MTEYVGAIEKQTLQNTYFRQVLFTAKHSQLVLMCLRPRKIRFQRKRGANRTPGRRSGGPRGNLPQRREYVAD